MFFFFFFHKVRFINYEAQYIKRRETEGEKRKVICMWSNSLYVPPYSILNFYYVVKSKFLQNQTHPFFLSCLFSWIQRNVLVNNNNNNNLFLFVCLFNHFRSYVKSLWLLCVVVQFRIVLDKVMGLALWKIYMGHVKGSILGSDTRALQQNLEKNNQDHN